MRLHEQLPKFNVAFGKPRTHQRQRSGSVSVPIIHEKWRHTPACLAPGSGDMKELEKQDERLQAVARRLHLSIRIFQIICS